jgi:hypothetical protein
MSNGKNNKALTIIVGVLSVILVSGAIFMVLFLSKHEFVAKGDNQKIISYKEVCTSADIDKYNGILHDENGFSVNVLREFNDDIIARADYKGDPNCAYMSMNYYFRALDFARSEESAKLFKELTDKGYGASAKISGIQSIRNIDEILEAQKRYQESQTQTE